jgi:1,4-alpha-glucan branching enzyme
MQNPRWTIPGEHPIFSAMSRGYLALVLHAHLPYVRHPEYPEFLEEDWLYEAITETYVPLLQVLHGLVDDGVDFKLTMSLTPTLCSMLRDPLLQERYVRYIGRAIDLAKKEVERNRDNAQMREIAGFYLERFTSCRHLFVDKWKSDLVSVFRDLQDRGFLEIITCAATHGFLPLMEHFPEAVRAQIFIARDHYRECFGRDPKGIWLPECGYVSGVEKVLQEANIRWFIIDSHGLMFGNPRPRYAIYAPCFTPAGPAAFARDRESSRQVWSAEEGYPGDPAYRDFYRDIGFDLSQEYLKPWLQQDGARKFTGIKYHRITGHGQEKELYNRSWAMGAADSHAGNFMWSRMKQIEQVRNNTNIDPIVISPFDAELFGHWWFEGPEFLNLFIRKSVYDQQEFKLTTPAQYLTEHPTQQLVVPSASSWGHKGYWEVWLDESNAWIYPHLHMAAKRMTEIARVNADTKSELVERAMRQLARELLLAQSSDWAFLMKTGTAKDYATKRTKDHILRFTRLYDQVRCKAIDEDFLKNCEWRDNIFPSVNWRYYL